MPAPPRATCETTPSSTHLQIGPQRLAACTLPFLSLPRSLSPPLPSLSPRLPLPPSPLSPPPSPLPLTTSQQHTAAYQTPAAGSMHPSPPLPLLRSISLPLPLPLPLAAFPLHTAACQTPAAGSTHPSPPACPSPPSPPLPSPRLSFPLPPLPLTAFPHHTPASRTRVAGSMRTPCQALAHQVAAPQLPGPPRPQTQLPGPVRRRMPQPGAPLPRREATGRGRRKPRAAAGRASSAARTGAAEAAAAVQRAGAADAGRRSDAADAWLRRRMRKGSPKALARVVRGEPAECVPDFRWYALWCSGQSSCVRALAAMVRAVLGRQWQGKTWATQRWEWIRQLDHSCGDAVDEGSRFEATALLMNS